MSEVQKKYSAVELPQFRQNDPTRRPQKHQAQACIKHTCLQCDCTLPREGLEQELKPGTCALTEHANNHWHQQGLAPETPK